MLERELDSIWIGFSCRLIKQSSLGGSPQSKTGFLGRGLHFLRKSGARKVNKSFAQVVKSGLCGPSYGWSQTPLTAPVTKNEFDGC